MSDTHSRVDWLGIALFFAVACSWSFLAARHAALVWPLAGPAPRFDDSIIAGFGPVAGGLAAGLLGRGNGFGPLIGQPRGAVLVALAAPTVSVALFGLKRAGWEPHLDALIFGLSVTLYCCGEELGWRGWLHRAIEGLGRGRAALVTAGLWYAWHWTFLADQLVQPAFGLGFALAIGGASWALHGVRARSGGAGLPVAWHAAAKLLALPAQMALMLGVLAWATWTARTRQP